MGLVASDRCPRTRAQSAVPANVHRRRLHATGDAETRVIPRCLERWSRLPCLPWYIRVLSGVAYRMCSRLVWKHVGLAVSEGLAYGFVTIPGQGSGFAP